MKTARTHKNHYGKGLEVEANRRCRTRASRQNTAPALCDVCDQPPVGTRRLHFDHDHATGIFRGWLCHGCNLALGLVKDNPGTLRRLAAYLERKRPNPYRAPLDANVAAFCLERLP